ncbi:MAG: RimK family alpha-L-glutamate ligase [Planctomycetaceae bacterium]|nr:RimK family alpha-L-glutamate ligase [Planctomycetaceae bacterium]
MRILLLGSPEQNLNQQIHAAAVDQGLDCLYSSLDQLTCSLGRQTAVRSATENRLQIESEDVLLVRSIPPGTLEQVVFRMDLLWMLEQQSVRIVNPPKAIECAIDKFLTSARCHAAGLRVPETVCSQSAKAALESYEQLGGDVVAKPLFGAEGRGMIHVNDPETAGRVFRAWEQIGAVILLQRFLRTTATDLRVMVLGNQILGAIRRTATRDFRTNSAQQGTATLHQISDQEAELALKACQATGVLFGGVDLMYDDQDQLHLLEVNASPGWKQFQSVTGIPVASRLVEWIRQTS